MTPFRLFVAGLALVTVTALAGGSVLAQPPAGGPPAGQHQQHQGPRGGMPMGGRGMGMMGDAMGHGQPSLCARLTGAPMPAEPRGMGRMLQLCGEMLKSMGEVMMKHGKQMETGG